VKTSSECTTNVFWHSSEFLVVSHVHSGNSLMNCIVSFQKNSTKSLVSVLCDSSETAELFIKFTAWIHWKWHDWLLIFNEYTWMHSQTHTVVWSCILQLYLIWNDFEWKEAFWKSHRRCLWLHIEFRCSLSHIILWF
jgi:hypothetical protein